MSKPPVPRMNANGALITPPRITPSVIKAVPTPGAPGFTPPKAAHVSAKGTFAGSDAETKRIGDKLLARLAKNDTRATYK